MRACALVRIRAECVRIAFRRRKGTLSTFRAQSKTHTHTHIYNTHIHLHTHEYYSRRRRVFEPRRVRALGERRSVLSVVAQPHSVLGVARPCVHTNTHRKSRARITSADLLENCRSFCPRTALRKTLWSAGKIQNKPPSRIRACRAFFTPTPRRGRRPNGARPFRLRTTTTLVESERTREVWLSEPSVSSTPYCHVRTTSHHLAQTR